MADGLARGDRHWTGAAQRGQGGVGSEPVGVVPGGDQQLAGGLDPDAAAGQQQRGGLAGQGDEVRVERGQLGGQGLVAAGQVAQGPVGGAGRVGAASGLLGHQALDSLGGRQRVQLGVQLLGRGDQQIAELVGGLGGP
jgi:hypothetical protein